VSQLDLFGVPPPAAPRAAAPDVQEAPFDLPGKDPQSPIEGPKEPAKPRPAPQPKPEAPEGPVHASGHTCARCDEEGLGLCANCAGVGDATDPLPNVDLDDRCIVIGCSCVTMGAEIEGRPVCNLHDTAATREVMATGAWPAWYSYSGKFRVVPTVRRLDDMGHAWAGVITSEKYCKNCELRYFAWASNRFAMACIGYQQPDLTKGLFRPCI
jgi:hypothetical protein